MMILESAAGSLWDYVAQQFASATLIDRLQLLGLAVLILMAAKILLNQRHIARNQLRLAELLERGRRDQPPGPGPG